MAAERLQERCRARPWEAACLLLKRGASAPAKFEAVQGLWQGGQYDFGSCVCRCPLPRALVVLVFEQWAMRSCARLQCWPHFEACGGHGLASRPCVKHFLCFSLVVGFLSWGYWRCALRLCSLLQARGSVLLVKWGFGQVAGVDWFAAVPAGSLSRVSKLPHQPRRVVALFELFA